MHVLSLPPAFVLSQDQTLKLKRSDFGCLCSVNRPLKKAATGSRLNRREHSHLNDQHMSAIKRNCLEKRVRQCLLNRDPSSEEPQGKSRTCRPRFSFFHIRLSKNKAAKAAFNTSKTTRKGNPPDNPIKRSIEPFSETQGRSALSPAAPPPSL